MSLVLLRGRLMEDPIIDQKANETIVTINVKLDSFNGEEPSTKTFKYTETGLNTANNMKRVANSLATQMSFSKKGNKVFIQVNLDKDGKPEEKIYDYFDQLTQNGKNVK